MGHQRFHARLQWPRVLSLIALFFGLAVVARSEPIQLVVPDGYVNLEASASGGWPERLRAQYIYRSDQFAGLPDGGAYVTAISFRPDGSTGLPAQWSTNELTISATVTNAEPASMSGTFAENVPASNPLTVIRATAPWQGGTQNLGPAGGPKAFDIDFALDTPLLYNPADGNLLLEFVAQGQSSAPVFMDRLAADDLSEAAVIVAWSWDPEGPIPDAAYSNGYVGAMPIQLTFASLPGDYSGNAAVENSDLTLLLNNWAQAVPPRPDGWIGSPLTGPAVDNDELTALLNHWGESVVGGAVLPLALNGDTGVPEPGSLVLLMAAVSAVVARPRRQSISAN
jgi:hypothetical protein